MFTVHAKDTLRLPRADVLQMCKDWLGSVRFKQSVFFLCIRGWSWAHVCTI